MKATYFAATLAAIATGVAALPAPVAIAPESLSLLRRDEQAQAEQQASQNTQVQQQAAAPQDAQKEQQAAAPQDAQAQQQTAAPSLDAAAQSWCWNWQARSYYWCNQQRQAWDSDWNNYPLNYNDGSQICYANGQYFYCNEQGGYLAYYPGTGVAPYYGQNTNWRDYNYGSGFQIDSGRPGYLGGQGRTTSGTILPGADPQCQTGADGTLNCVA